MTTNNGKRLNKFISDSGLCSRREADKLIEQNRVKVNGKPVELGTKVTDEDEVIVNGRLITAKWSNRTDRVYIVYNKPIGITCTTELAVEGNIIDAISHKERIFPIGRLDKPSEGLIFLTSDGDIVNKILRAENAHDKEYIVTVDQPISERFIDKMSRGVPVLDTVTKPCKVVAQSRFVFTITLTQGLNRQIRRMCEFLGYSVVHLKRIRIMSITLDGLKPGQWRNLTPAEMDELNRAVAHSSKTAVEKNPLDDDTDDDGGEPITPLSTPRKSPYQNKAPITQASPYGAREKSPQDSPYGKAKRGKRQDNDSTRSSGAPSERNTDNSKAPDPWGKAKQRFE